MGGFGTDSPPCPPLAPRSRPSRSREPPTRAATRWSLTRPLTLTLAELIEKTSRQCARLNLTPPHQPSQLVGRGAISIEFASAHDSLGHADHVVHGCDIVHPHRIGPIHDRYGHRRGGAKDPLCSRFPGQITYETLA